MTRAGAAFRADLAVVALVFATIALMVVPLPTAAVDALLAASMGLGVVLLLVAFHLRSPLDLSSLPAVILVSTVFRLALAIATTRLVLLQADAGEIILAFGEFVVGGNIVVGLVVFLIITVVQFVVIAKGAERVAEVAARFALDAMPGKQMAIDADLRAGEVGQDEARRRRSLLERESQFYGAMDGAMKFVKGDAIAGLVIIAVNLLGGLAVGVLQNGMPVGEAARTYSVLAVGDALVAQIPALFVAIAAGVVVTRVGGADEEAAAGGLGAEIVGQLGADPRALRLAAGIAALLGLVPGLPTAVFLGLAALLALLARAAGGSRRPLPGTAEAVEVAAEPEPASAAALPAAAPVVDARLRLLLSPALAVGLPAARLRDALHASTRGIAEQMGVPVPVPEPTTAPELPGEHFRLDLDGVPVLEGELSPDRVLLRDDPEHAELAGVATERGEAPGTKGVPAHWAWRGDVPALAAAGVGHAEAAEALAGAVDAALRRHAAQFMGIQEARAMLDRLAADYPELVGETIRTTPLQRVAEVMRRLAEDGVPLRNLRGLLEALVDHGAHEKDASVLAELARQGLRRQICHRHADPNRTIAAYTVDADAEAAVLAAVQRTPTGTFAVLRTGAALGLVERIRAELLRSRGPAPVILSSLPARRHLRSLMADNNVDVAVISHNDLDRDFRVQPLGAIRLPDEEGARGAGGGPSPVRPAAERPA